MVSVGLWMAAALAGFGLAGCATTGPSATVGGIVVEPAPSSTRIKLANPDRNKWSGVRMTGRFAPPPNSRAGIWLCRPMACPGRASVSVLMQRSPTRNPDRKALEQSAKLFAAQAKAQDTVLEVTSEGNERITSLSTRVTDVRGYPAIVGEFEAGRRWAGQIPGARRPLHRNDTGQGERGRHRAGAGQGAFRIVRRRPGDRRRRCVSRCAGDRADGDRDGAGRGPLAGCRTRDAVARRAE